MATLYKHGEIGQIERLCYKLAYCQDGKILRNDGDGWKLWRSLKPGVDPVDHFKRKQAEYQAKLDTNPAFAEWRKTLHSTICFSKRWMVLEAIRMLGNDIDGLWSELNDMAGIPIDFEECQELVWAYERACDETKDRELVAV